MKKELNEKLMEALKSVLPVILVVIALSVTFVPMPIDTLLLFLAGSVFLVIGMALFSLGAEIAMTPMGDSLGAFIASKKNIFLLAIMGTILGFIITVAEPGLIVLADQVGGIPNMVIIIAVSAGVGIFLAIGFLRTVLGIELKWLLLCFYGALFVFAFFVPEGFLPMAFDAGGATTGAMTVPFIMALGVGVSSVRYDKEAENDSFGMIAVCSIGPIITVMILGLLYTPEGGYDATYIEAITATNQIGLAFLQSLPVYTVEVIIALSPIVIFFYIFQFSALKLPNSKVGRITIGLVYTLFGLALFLTGASVGFLPTGNILGSILAELEFNWILVPVAMVIGWVVITAEPAVAVLNKQVESITNGSISAKAMGLSLSIGVSISLGISMVRILTGIPILWVLLPGYAIAVGLSFYVPKIFTSIAFDSGGVASGPLTSTFLLPFAIGASYAVGGDIVTDAFGIIAMVAFTPLITIQILGVIATIKGNPQELQGFEDEPVIIELGDDE